MSIKNNSKFYGIDYYPSNLGILSNKLEFYNLWNKESLFDYQEFVRRFMSPYTPFKNLFLFHNLGSGKTLTCVSIAIDHYEVHGYKALIITKNTHGQDTFRREIKKYNLLHMDGKISNIMDVFVFQSYMEFNNILVTLSNAEIKKTYSNMIIIMDEIHHVKYNTNPSSVYYQLKRTTSVCTNIKTILCTATPMMDNIDQINTIMMLVDDIYISYNNRVQDIASYVYHGVNIHENLPNIYQIKMSDTQGMHYKQLLRTQIINDVYRSESQLSLFCSTGGLYGKRFVASAMRTEKYTDHYDMIFEQEGYHKSRKISYNMYHVLPEYEDQLTTLLSETSCKYHELIRQLEDSNNLGTFFVYIDEVMGSGVIILCEILRLMGYELYIGGELRTLSKGKRFTFCVGEVELCPNIIDRISGFNYIDNKDGEYVKVLIGSRVIGESITLRNVRHFHCLTPHWNKNVINQAIGRVIRSKSHEDLDTSDRLVNIYIYSVVYDNIGNVDTKKLEISNNKQNKINAYINKLKNNSIENYLLDDDSISQYDIATFVKYYLVKYEDDLFTLMHNYLLDVKQCTIITLEKYMHMVDYRIVRLLLYKTIAKNINISITSQLYVRLYLDKIILVDNKDIPFITISLDKYTVKNELTIPICMPESKSDYHIPFDTITVNDIKSLNGAQAEKLLEDAIRCNNKHVMTLMKGCYVVLNDKRIIHTICYSKNYNQSYKAVLPLPTEFEGLMRCFKDNEWYNLDKDTERDIVQYLRTRYVALMKEITSFPFYGILSTIDMNMRISIGMTESTEPKRTRDNRNMHRGRVIKTIVKSDLLIIFAILQQQDVLSDIYTNKKKFTALIDVVDEYNLHYNINTLKMLTANKLATLIESSLVDNDIYVII